ncbi:SLATT domain-containing protein [Xanthomonas translucens pv. poae]|nr:SLATT domain-containing protein [Xanthomonas translucens pv. poae]
MIKNQGNQSDITERHHQMNSCNTPSLTYLEEKILHPTRTARFASARRLRLTQIYATYGQLLSAVALIFWSLVPAYFPGLASERLLSFFGVMASIVVLVLGIQQQAAGYIDLANSLEDSARKIDGLRRKVQSSIMAGLDLDPSAYDRLSGEYTNILNENPANHSTYDHQRILRNTVLSWLPDGVVVHIWASFFFVLTLLFVVVIPCWIIAVS